MIDKKWGFLRETCQKATESGIDEDTGLHRTGLEDYLNVIFPDITDWVHDKSIPSSKRKIRPDYRSESLKIIVEFDGMQHYTKPTIIANDKENTKFYKELGYKVVRIPYFIQLTKQAIKTLFDIDLSKELFDGKIPSLGGKIGQNSPAFLCPAGIKRMAEEFSQFPEQYEVNRQALKKEDNEFYTGVNLLEIAYNEIIYKK